MKMGKRVRNGRKASAKVVNGDMMEHGDAQKGHSSRSLC